jgi:hypothetical protein
MSKIYLVAYDFRGSSDNYSDLFDELQKSPRWWHWIDSVWLLRTEESADEIYERLEQYLDNDISLFITEIGSDHQGWLPDKAWKWIRKHVDREGRSSTQMQPAQ